jgi:hypothetical protein
MNGLTFTKSGTVTLSGGSMSEPFSVDNSGLAPPSGINVILKNAFFKTSNAFGGAGTITLEGATVSATGQAPSGTIKFDSVASGGTPNVFNFSSYTTGLTLENLGYGDTISRGTSGTLSLTLNSGSSTVYTLKDTLNSDTISTNVTLAPGTILKDFTSSNGKLAYTGDAGCFLAGTRLATPCGEIAVEDIIAGTMLLTASGDAKPVRWLGRSVIATRFADPLTKLPIRIKAGALGENLPVRDLLVSPCHAIFIGNVLVHAGALVNGASIIRETDVPEVFTYYHVELATHELLLAEGAPAESFVDNVDRMAFQNWAAHEAITDPEPIEEMPYARAKSHRQVPMHIRRMLADRATPSEPAKAA